MPNRKPREASVLRRLGDALVRRRILQGKTQEDVAHRAGISVQYLSRVERGTGNPSYLKLRAIAKAIGVDVAAVVADAERS